MTNRGIHRHRKPSRALAVAGLALAAVAAAGAATAAQAAPAEATATTGGEIDRNLLKPPPGGMLAPVADAATTLFKGGLPGT
ncbi:hypothetical protein [Streptomyces qinzhouensis]|uniref:Uncharacterized protein n=1 Tax=Streptomyces qinzhouensis TaxID=2599401 RepID=A0A5B8IJV4_9ACTN|nr:hypothetical protein [Streptomyces qinzhouensis]QDY78758.1 hypothetical protein FQU76_22095 [Streptomyces qinzhouensis]